MAAFNETLRLVLDVDMRKGSQEVDLFARRLDNVGSTMTKVGGTLTRSVTLPILALGGIATKMASDFDGAFVRMQTLAGVSASEIDGLKESVLDLAGETGRAPQELAEALYFVRSSGLAGQEALDALEMSAKGAAAGLGSTIEVADAVTSAINGYGAANLSAAEATDVLVATAREGKAEASELAPQFGRLVPIAAELGVSFDQVGAGMAFLTRASGDASLAATQLNGVLTKLLEPGEEGRKTLERIGVSVQELRASVRERGLLGALEELRRVLEANGLELGDFSRDQQFLQGALQLTGASADDAAEVFAKLEDSAGATDDAFAKWAESMGAKNTRAFAELQAAMIRFGDVLIPIITQVIGFVGELAEVFSDLPEGVQQAIVGFLALAAALGPVMSIGGNVVQVVSTLTKVTGSLGTALGSMSLALGGLTAVLGIAALAVYGYTRRKAEAQKITADLVETFKLEGEAQRVAQDAIAANSLATGELGEKLQAAGTNVRLFGDEMRNNAENARELQDDIQATAGRYGEWVDVLEEAAGSGNRLAAQILELVETQDLSMEQAVNLLSVTSDLSDRYSEASSEAEANSFAQEQLAGAAAEAGLAFDEQGNLVETATDALKEYTDQLAATFDPIFGMIDALHASQEAQATLRQRSEELAAATRDYGAGSAEAQQAQEALTAAQDAARSSVIDLNSAATTLKFAIDEQGLSVDSARRQFVSMAMQMGFTQGEAGALADEFGLVEGAARDMAGNYNVGVSSTGVGGTIGNLVQVRETINSIDRRIDIEVAYHASGSPITRRQHGGPFMANQLLKVGEAGYEYAVFPQAGHVLDHASSVALDRYMTASPGHPVASGGGWGGGAQYVDHRTINVYTAADPQSVVEALKRYERSNGALPIKVR